MKKIMAGYPIEGTSALQPIFDSAPSQHARIITFPTYQARQDDRAVRAPSGSHVKAPAHCLESNLVSTVRTGSAQGLAFGRFQRWQAVVGGCVFTALAFVGVLAGM